VAIGSARAYVTFTVNTMQQELGCELYIPNDKALYNELKKSEHEIEREIGEKLEWMALPEKKASRIKIVKPADFDKDEEWENYFSWLKEKGELFEKVFPKYLREARTG
jgi:hypothetical protein